MTTVAWIGLGAMGLGMATHLASLGVRVQAFDVYPPSLAKATGCIPCKTPLETVQNASVLCLMVVNIDQVEDLLFGTHNLAKALKPDSVIVVFSTCPPSAMPILQARLDILGTGVGLIDSPVSGGSGRAAKGTLAVMVSGSPKAVETARPVLSLLTQKPEGNLAVVGDRTGVASDFKLINQVYCAVQLCVMGESMAFAKSLGLNPRLVHKVIMDSSGASSMFGMRVPFQLRDDGTIHSAMTIISKDVGIVMDDARLQTFPAPMCSVAEQLFVGALGAGLARDDDVNIVKMYDYFGVPPSLETGTEEEEIERAKELTVTPSHPPKKVLFVGLGAMGAPMAAVLSVSGLQVAGYDVSLEAMDRFAKVGGRVVGDPAVEAKDSDAVVICTVTALQAEAFLASVAPALPAGATIILCSTISPTDALRLQALLDQHGKGLSLVDAPMAGGPTRAATGDLTIMASGTPEALSAASPVLQLLAKNKLHYIPGGVGSGSKMKIVNNLLAGIHLCAAAEATALAVKKGMDLAAVYDVVSSGAAWTYVMVDGMPRMLAKSPPVLSAVTTFVKDLGIALAEAKKHNVPAFLATAAHQQFIRAVASGWGEDDDSAVSRLWEFMGIHIAS